MSADIQSQSVSRKPCVEEYLREVDAGTTSACWVGCAKGNPGAVRFTPAEMTGASLRMIAAADRVSRAAADQFFKTLSDLVEILESKEHGVVLECMGPRVPLIELLDAERPHAVVKRAKALISLRRI